jgi:hypothetical protein
MTYVLACFPNGLESSSTYWHISSAKSENEAIKEYLSAPDNDSTAAQLFRERGKLIVIIGKRNRDVGDYGLGLNTPIHGLKIFTATNSGISVTPGTN